MHKQLEAPSEQVLAAMRQAAAPSGADLADEAARVLANRLQGNGSATLTAKHQYLPAKQIKIAILAAEREIV